MMLGLRSGVKVVRADSGGTFNGTLRREWLVDGMGILVCSSLVGGTRSKFAFRASDLVFPDGVIPLKLTSMEKPDGDAVLLRHQVMH